MLNVQTFQVFWSYTLVITQGVLSIATVLKSHVLVRILKYGLNRMDAFAITDTQSSNMTQNSAKLMDCYDTFANKKKKK